MKISITRPFGWNTTRRFVLLVSLATFSLADAPAVALVSNDDVASFAMRWFKEIQAGRTDRSLYAATYGAQITDASVEGLSKTLNRYGASPLRAEIVQTRKSGDQTFYIIKFIFPRGDATSLLFGFDTRGKITAIAIGTLAGD